METPYNDQKDFEYNEIRQRMNVFQIPEIEENVVSPTFLECLFPSNAEQDFEYNEIRQRMDVFQIPELQENLVIPTFLEFTAEKQEAIQKFMVTYDTSYLKRKNFNIPEIELLKTKLWKNKVLTILLQNYLRPVHNRHYTLKYIEGPFSLRIYQGQIHDIQVGNLYMTLYIYGEYHRDTSGQCYEQLRNQLWDRSLTIQEHMDIWRYPNNYTRFRSFLQQLALETPSFFDFFIETSVDRRDNNTRASIFGHNWGMDYFDLQICFEEMASWVSRFFPTTFDNTTRQIDLDIINMDLSKRKFLRKKFVRERFPDLNSFINVIQYRRLDDRNNPHPNMKSFRIMPIAKKILLNIGGRLVLPAPGTPEWYTYIVHELHSMGEEPIPANSYEMLQMKDDFKECFKLQERKTLTVGSHGVSNISKCRLGRFHDIDARKIDREHATLNAIELGYGIVYNYFVYNPPRAYNLNNTIFLPLIRDSYNRVDLGHFIEYINRIEHQNEYDATIAIPIQGVTDQQIGQIYGIINFCLEHFPRLGREMNSCPEFYRRHIIAFIINRIITNNSNIIGRPLIDIRDVLGNVSTVLAGQTTPAIPDNDTALLCLIMLSGHFFMIYVYVMDLYCLFRLFKQYRRKSDCQPNKNYNAIIYAGDTHSNCYREFIEYHRNLQLTDLQRREQSGEITNDRRRTLEQKIFTQVYDYRNPNHFSCVTIPPNLLRPGRNLGIYQENL